MKKNLIYFIIFICLSSNAQEVTTFAGSGSQGSADGAGIAATFYNPQGMAIDGSGNLYIPDKNNHIIRKITPTGLVSTFAGSGTYGSTDGFGNSASFYFPKGIAVDGLGNIYVADNGNRKIRKITPGGDVTTFAGNGTNGSTDGDGILASFKGPQDVAVDVSGNVYVADEGYKIRKITPTGFVSTLAGSGTFGSTDGLGTSASFNLLYGVAVDASGNVYVGDSGNHKIRKITPSGLVTTLAGSGSYGNADGLGTSASFFYPSKLVVDGLGNVYVADSNNHTIRKITPGGSVTTLAGSGISGSADGTGMAASFSFPNGIALDVSGNIFVTDLVNNKIRKIIQTLSSPSFDIQKRVKIYPNPANKVVFVDLEGLSNVQLQVYEINGRELFKQTLDELSNRIIIEDLAKGMFLFKITSDQGSKSQIVIKN